MIPFDERIFFRGVGIPPARKSQAGAIWKVWKNKNNHCKGFVWQIEADMAGFNHQITVQLLGKSSWFADVQ